MASNLVFVYGSLKRGYWNNRVLRDGDARFVDLAITTQHFRMWSSGFPMIQRADPGDDMAGRVVGEVWRVPAHGMPRLDALESNGTMYRRQLMPVLIAGVGEPVFAEGYVWLRATRDLRPVPPRDGVLLWRESRE